MSEPAIKAAPLVLAGSGDDLAKQTLKMVGLLVGACVLFVGTLSLLAVLITNKAFGPTPSAAEMSAPAKDAKKPLSI